MIDRFGLLPDPTRNLLMQTEIRLHAESLGIAKIEAGEKGGYIEFAEHNNVDPGWLIGLLQQDPKQWKLEGPVKLRFTRDLSERQLRIDWLMELLAQMDKHRIKAQ